MYLSLKASSTSDHFSLKTAAGQEISFNDPGQLGTLIWFFLYLSREAWMWTTCDFQHAHDHTRLEVGNRALNQRIPAIFMQNGSEKLSTRVCVNQQSHGGYQPYMLLCT